MIYLDNAATTPVLKESAEAANHAHSELFFNPSALYAKEVSKRIDDARATVAAALGVSSQEIYFTSGATEANNLALFSGIKNKNLSLVISRGEHASVYAAATALQGKGIKTHFAPLERDTCVNADILIELAAADCGLVSLIHASNETGAVNDIAAIFKEIKKRNAKVILHSDGVQAFLKTDTNLAALGADMYAISGHKVGAPKGIGALYVKKNLQLTPLLHGGGQERGLRSGTENVSGILAFAAACKVFKARYTSVDYTELRTAFCNILLAELGDLAKCVAFHANSSHSIPNFITMSVIGVPAEILQRILADKDAVIIGLGSACAASKRGNRVLEAAGKSKQEIAGNVRISFGLDTVKTQAETAAKKIAYRIREIQGGHIG